MAQPVGFEGTNFTFTAPDGMEDTVQDLSVCKFDGHTVSCWRLTEAELAQVVETGVVWLQVTGHRMPPVYLSGKALVLVGGRPAKAEPILTRTTNRGGSDAST